MGILWGMLYKNLCKINFPTDVVRKRGKIVHIFNIHPNSYIKTQL